MSGSDGIRLAELRHVVSELKELCGAPIYDVWVPTRSCVILAIGRRKLLIESYPVPRIHLVRTRPKNPAKPFSFQGLLRARLRGRLDDIRILHDDRVVEVVVGDLRIHARLFGRGGGIWLVNSADVVLAAVDGPAPPELPTIEPGVDSNAPPRFDGTPSWNESADAWFLERTTTLELDLWLRHVNGGIKRAKKRQRRLVKNLEGDLERAEGAEGLRRDADCLAAVVHTLRRGLEQVVVPDLWTDGGERTITLDPSHSPADNLNRMYDKAGRLHRAFDQIFERLEVEREKLDHLVSEHENVQRASLPELKRLAKAHRLGAPGPRALPKAPARNPWWTWQSPDGVTVHVGRTAEGNRALTFKYARGRDWWFHLRDRPGAHVILRRDQRTPPPLEHLMAAAQFVVAQARVEPGTSADVQYSRVADLRSLPDAGVAGVAVHKERVVHVMRDADVLVGWTRLEET